MRHPLSGYVVWLVESWLMRLLNLSLSHLSHRVQCGTKGLMPHVCVCLRAPFPTRDLSRQQLIWVESSFAGRGTKSLFPFTRSCAQVARTRSHMMKNASICMFHPFCGGFLQPIWDQNKQHCHSERKCELFRCLEAVILFWVFVFIKYLHSCFAFGGFLCLVLVC